MQLNLNKNDLIQQRYIIQQKIGEGGMSVVYKATDKERKRDVALKFLKPGITSSYVEDVIRFKKEAELVSKFEHPHIIKLYGTGDYDNTPYLIEELLEGRTLSDLLEQKNAFSVKEAVQVIRQIIEALNYVHHKGVIHRDLKPGNIMICNPLAVDRLPLSVESRKSGVTPPQRTTANGKRATLNIKLLDFGLAHIMELSKIKEEKEIVGTFGYMSPEATGIMNKRIDERSDLYSLGIIFYQLLSERLPFNATDISTLLHQQVAIEPPKLKEIKPDIPKILEEIIIKLLNKEPDLRYQSAKGLLYDIDRYQKGEMSFIIGEKDQKIKISYQTRLVGREEETHKIKELFDRARDNQGRICLINGEPGVGKSKLVEETLEYLYDQGYKKDGVFISARCLNQENKIPYQPFRDALNDYIRKIEDIDDQEKQNQEIERIKNVVGDLNEIIVHLNPNMKDILGKTQKLINLDPERENQRFLMATSNFFCNLAQKGENCVLFIDDLQWADEASLRLIQEIATKIDKSNLLILGTYRDEEINKKHGLNRVKKEPVVNDIKLKKLDYKRLNKMIANILGEEQEKAYVLTEYILNKSEGNPFFAITILRELVEQKALIWEHGYWKEDWDKIKTIRISDNIIDMILRRIKGLSDELDRLLRIGASIGKEFEIKMLYELIDEKREAIISWIDEAENMQLLERSITKKGKVLFIHDRIREAFYKKMTDEEKRNNHLKIGKVIEKINKQKIENAIFDLAHHYTEGQDKEKALEYVIPAAKKAKANYANDDAIRYYKTGIEFLEDRAEKNSKTWINTNEELAEVYLTAGRNEEAIGVAKKILPLKESPLEKAKIYRKIGSAYFKKGEWAKCEDNLAKGLALLGDKVPRSKTEVIFSLLKELIIHILHSLFPRIFSHKKGKAVKPEEKEKILIYISLDWVFILSDTNKFIYTVLRMLNISQSKIGKSKELGISFGAYASLCMAIPLFKRAIKYHEKSLKLKKELKDEWGLAQSLQLLGFCYSWKGNYKKSIEIFEKASERFKQIGDMWELGMIIQGLGISYHYLSNYNKSFDCLSQYLEITKKLKDAYGASSCEENISLSHIEKGDFEKAKDLLEKALSLSEKNKICFIIGVTNIHLGYLELERKNYNKSIQYLQKAKQINEDNTFIEEYTSLLYPHLSDAYIEQFKLKSPELSTKQKKQELKKIKKSCKQALNKTKHWVNHYGIALRVTAKYYALIQKNKKVEKYFLKSRLQTRDLGRKYECAKSHYEYGIFLKAKGKLVRSIEALQYAQYVFDEIGAKEYVKRCTKILRYKMPMELIKSDVSPQERLQSDQRMNTILNTSRYLSSILDLDMLLEKIMERTTELIGAEREVLLLYPDKEEGKEYKLEVKIARDVKTGKRETFTTSKTILSKVIQNNKPLIIDDASKDTEFNSRPSVITSGAKSVLCAPIITKGETLGAIYLDNRLVSGLFTEDDLKVLELISSQAGVSIENARLYSQMKEKERLKKEMEIAERIQTAIVPQPPQHKDLEITALMYPAEEVGGDYYDIMFDKQNNLWFAIGDVSGHGVTAGLIMMMAQAAFSANIKDRNITPKKAIISVNNVLCENVKTRLNESHFMTMSFLKYTGNGNFIYAGAHLDIIVYRNKTKKCELIKTEGVYLGILPNISKDTRDLNFSLNTNDIMVLYTDGITEARHTDHNNKKRIMGKEKLQEIIIKTADKGIEEMKNSILTEALNWYKGHQLDDITMILVRRK